ncbi:hypothetical protein BPAE_0001g00850 [Botrytis paeoniae]|uniref:Uncharacterized protein n=1 Tax=Botrytis paeoniae TaxID=278948 RepID=A0A4Z1G6W1_9HELO|nr:hypothetical protein BPAE_0001g00850 [Botrytis paeoniae]
MDEDSVRSAFLNNSAHKNVVVAQLLIVVQSLSHTNKYTILFHILEFACDFDIRRARGARDGPGRVAIGCPGVNAGASPAREPVSDVGPVCEFEVSCPPNTLPLAMGCPRPPPLRPPRPNPPLLPLPPPRLFAFEFRGFDGAGGFESGSGATEAGLRAKEPFVTCVVRFGVAFVFASAGAGPLFRWPPRLGRRVRVRGGRLEPGAGDDSVVAMICEYNEPVVYPEILDS